MAFCVQCGAQLDDNAKFCTVCGAKRSGASAPAAVPAPSAFAEQNNRSSYDPTVYSGGPGGGSQPPKKKKGGLIALIILASLIVIGVVIFLVVSMAGGRGKASSDDPALGLYTAQKAESNGLTVDVKDMWSKGFTIELKDKDKATLVVDGTKGNAKWTLDGEEISINGTGTNRDLELNGTLKDGVMVLEDVLDSGVTLYLTKEGTRLPRNETPAPAPVEITPAPAPVEITPTPAPVEITPAPSEGIDWWEGDWYGWWYVSDAGGLYLENEFPGCFWDSCAVIDVNGSSGTIECWDEDNDWVVRGTVSFSDGLSGRGSMSNVSTRFWDYDMPADEWYADPADENFKEYPETIILFGRYEDPENVGSWFEYTIFLRPWGARWEDLDEGMLTHYYEDWYLPLIEAGEPMPEYFEGLE